MSVFKEINSYIQILHHACLTTRIYNDAADCGLPLTKDQGAWASIKYHLSKHTVPGSKKKLYKGAHQITIATYDNEHSHNPIRSYYEITFHFISSHNSLITPCTGYLTIRKVMPTEHDRLNELHRLEYDASLLHYKGYTYSYELDDDGDVVKIFHYVTLPNNTQQHIGFSPYTTVTEELFKAFIDNGLPIRVQGNFSSIQDIEHAAANQQTTS